MEIIDNYENVMFERIKLGKKQQTWKAFAEFFNRR